MVGLEIIEAPAVVGPPSGIIWRPNVYAEIVGFVRNTVVASSSLSSILFSSSSEVAV